MPARRKIIGLKVFGPREQARLKSESDPSMESAADKSWNNELLGACVYRGNLKYFFVDMVHLFIYNLSVSGLFSTFCSGSSPPAVKKGMKYNKALFSRDMSWGNGILLWFL